LASDAVSHRMNKTLFDPSQMIDMIEERNT
jgi:hypothetical protein